MKNSFYESKVRVCALTAKYNVNLLGKKNIRVIKHKKVPLNIEFTNEFIKIKSIKTESDRIYIDNTSILLKDIKTLYLTSMQAYTKGLRRFACSLEIVGNNILKSKIITVIDFAFDESFIKLNGPNKFINIPAEELAKLEEIFDWFVFSHQISQDKIDSNEYEAIDDATSIVNNIKTYEDTDLIKLWNSRYTLSVDNKEYVLQYVLPICEKNKFNNTKYKVYISKFANHNYIDVWIESNAHKHLQRKDEVKQKFLMGLLYFSLFFWGILIILAIIKVTFGN